MGEMAEHAREESEWDEELGHKRLFDSKEWEEAEKCTCSEVRVGGRPTGCKNWNPDCRVHTEMPR